MSDMAKLFAEDPLRLTKEDRSLIIARYREARAQFNLGVAQAGSTKKVKAEAGPKLSSKSLDELLGE